MSTKFKTSEHVWINVLFDHIEEDGQPVEHSFKLKIKRIRPDQIASLFGTVDESEQAAQAAAQEALVVSWDGIEDAPEYSREAFNEYCQNHPGAQEAAGMALFEYAMGGRAKNLKALLGRFANTVAAPTSTAPAAPSITKPTTTPSVH